MPPVREPSTKPSAATVLPAPVACSNQKRLAALGPRAPRAAAPSSPRRRRASSSQSCGSSGSSSSSRSSSPGMPTEASGAAAGSAPRAGCRWTRCRCPDSASSAVSVPESASTWWADEDGAVGEVRLLLAEQPVEPEQQRPALAPGRPTAPSRPPRARPARRRARAGAAVPGASWTAASSPSSTNGSRVNAAARLIASSEGVVGVASTATEVGSAIRLGAMTVEGAATDCCATPRIRGPRSEAWLEGIPGGLEDRCSARLSIEADCAVEAMPGRSGSATVCGVKRALPWILGVLILTAVLVVGLTQAGGDSEQPAPAPRVRPRGARRRSSRARPRRSPRCTSSPRSCSTAGCRRSSSGWPRSRGRPVVINKWASWCSPCRAEFPVFQQLATERGREIAFLGVNSGDSTQPARDFLARVSGPVPVLPRPRREDRARDQGARQLPRSPCSSTRAARPRSSTRAATAPSSSSRPTSTATSAHEHRPTTPAGTGNEVRVDPLTGLKVIIAAARAGRPGGHFDLEPEPPIDTEKDPFLPGHEDRTPPELHALRARRRRPGHARLERARRAEPLPGARARRRRARRRGRPRPVLRPAARPAPTR